MKLLFDWFDGKDPVANGLPQEYRAKIQEHNHYGLYYAYETNVAIGEFLFLLNSVDVKAQFLNLSQRSRDSLVLIEPLGRPERLMGKDEACESVFKHLSQALLDKVRRGESKLLIYYSHEGFQFETLGFYDDLMASCRAWNVPPSSIYLVSGNLRQPLNFERWKKNKGLEETFQVLAYNHFWLLSRSNYAGSRYFPHEKYFATWTGHEEALKKKRKRKRFLCFNRLPKPARVALLCYLMDLNILDQGLVSLPASEEQEFDSDFSSLLDQHFDLSFRLNRQLPYLEFIRPLRIDVNEGVKNKAYTCSEQQVDFPWTYLETYFSLVNESCVDSEVLVPSEKTYKPIVNWHPFIINGNPGALAYLKQQGFKTFHPWIDESYDTEMDYGIRLTKIAMEVKRLCEMSDAQMERWYRELIPILKHNYHHFFSEQSRQEFRDFIKSLSRKESLIEKITPYLPSFRKNARLTERGLT